MMLGSSWTRGEANTQMCGSTRTAAGAADWGVIRGLHCLLSRVPHREGIACPVPRNFLGNHAAPCCIPCLTFCTVIKTRASFLPDSLPTAPPLEFIGGKWSCLQCSFPAALPEHYLAGNMLRGTRMLTKNATRRRYPAFEGEAQQYALRGESSRLFSWFGVLLRPRFPQED